MKKFLLLAAMVFPFALQAQDPLPSRNDKGLDEAAANGWTVVSMKDDWATVFPRKP